MESIYNVLIYNYAKQNGDDKQRFMMDEFWVTCFWKNSAFWTFGEMILHIKL